MAFDISSLANQVSPVLGQIFTTIKDIATQLGSYISPQNPAIGMAIIFFIGILLLKGKSENMLTYGILAAVVAFFLVGF